MANNQTETENIEIVEGRDLFDWAIFTIIHLVLILGIALAGYYTYGARLGNWVAASAVIAGCASMYLFAKDVPGETLMKILLYFFAALNAAYLVHNGAKSAGIQAYNDAQVKKFEVGMTAAARSTSRSIARQLGLSAKEGSQVEKIFDDEVAVIASILAFLELGTALVVFAVASTRRKRGRITQTSSKKTPQTIAIEKPVEVDEFQQTEIRIDRGKD